MAGIKVDVLWSPNHEDKFVTFGTEINLFKIEKVEDNAYKGQGTRVSDDTYASLLSVNSDNQYMKCIAWYPKMSPDHLIAVGQANGRVVLTSFGHGGSSDPHSLIGKEFVPRHARQCNYLAWNPTESHLLAEGLDKYRTDCSIVIWDVVSTPSVELTAVNEKRLSLSSLEATGISKPVGELGSSETTLSLAWFSNTPKTLISGMNNKHLKIFDLRDPSRPQNVAMTKAVYGVCVDPQCEHRLASFHEGLVSIWDVRNFDKPIFTFNEHRPVIKLNWCSTRYGLLGVLCKDSSVVKLYDVQHSNLGSDDLEPAVIARMVQPYGQHAVSSFAWHPTHENRMLTVTPSGTVKDVKVFERISVNWSPEFSLTWSCGRSILQCQTRGPLDDDISNKMKNRALKGYGIQGDFTSNLPLFRDDPQLISIWSWLELAKQLRDQSKLKPSSVRIPGINTIIHKDIQSEGIIKKWHGLGQRIYKVYQREEREKAMMLCDWGFQKDNALDGLPQRLVELGHYERAAAIVLFNLKIKPALSLLNEGAKKNNAKGDINLNVVAMALSGFTDDRNALWQDMCGQLRNELTDPYLRAMFGFLTCESDSFEDVVDEDIAIQDRVAFACIYLPDSKLRQFLEKLSKKMIEAGNLQGILLTGLTTEGIDLLQTYIDKTGDVQTATLVAIQSRSPEVINDHRVVTWIESYCGLLDRWRLWHQRAEFDVYYKAIESAGSRAAQQVYVSCNFCGKSVVGSLRGGNVRSRFITSGPSMNKPKITMCPSCRKPLPRCSLCLRNMGTASSSPQKSTRQETVRKDVDDHAVSSFTDWFTWCQSCRHGGHAGHITEWFKEHSECPVSGCRCKCTSLDATTDSYGDSGLQHAVDKL